MSSTTRSGPRRRAASSVAGPSAVSSTTSTSAPRRALDTDTVVLDHQDRLRGVTLEGDRDRRRLGVVHRVRDRFLGDAQDVLGAIRCQQAWPARDLELETWAVGATQHLQVGVELFGEVRLQGTP